MHTGLLLSSSADHCVIPQSILCMSPRPFYKCHTSALILCRIHRFLVTSHAWGTDGVSGANEALQSGTCRWSWLPCLRRHVWLFPGVSVAHKIPSSISCTFCVTCLLCHPSEKGFGELVPAIRSLVIFELVAIRMDCEVSSQEASGQLGIHYHTQE